MICVVYGTTGEFKYLFFVLAAMAGVMLVAAVCMPSQARKGAAAPAAAS